MNLRLLFAVVFAAVAASCSDEPQEAEHTKEPVAAATDEEVIEYPGLTPIQAIEEPVTYMRENPSCVIGVPKGISETTDGAVIRYGGNPAITIRRSDPPKHFEIYSEEERWDDIFPRYSTTFFHKIEEVRCISGQFFSVVISSYTDRIAYSLFFLDAATRSVHPYGEISQSESTQRLFVEPFEFNKYLGFARIEKDRDGRDEPNEKNPIQEMLLLSPSSPAGLVVGKFIDTQGWVEAPAKGENTLYLLMEQGAKMGDVLAITLDSNVMSTPPPTATPTPTPTLKPRIPRRELIATPLPTPRPTYVPGRRITPVPTPTPAPTPPKATIRDPERSRSTPTSSDAPRDERPQTPSPTDPTYDESEWLTSEEAAEIPVDDNGWILADEEPVIEDGWIIEQPFE